jgi:acyl-CoA dehydrogenase
MDEYIYPNELVYQKQHQDLPSKWNIPPLLDVLKSKAKKTGLWYEFILQ